MPPLYPLRFRPVFRRYLWGGRRLGAVLGKPIGAETDYAESWEIVDRGPDQSVVLAGALSETDSTSSGASAILLATQHPTIHRSIPQVVCQTQVPSDMSVSLRPNSNPTPAR